MTLLVVPRSMPTVLRILCMGLFRDREAGPTDSERWTSLTGGSGNSCKVKSRTLRIPLQILFERAGNCAMLKQQSLNSINQATLWPPEERVEAVGADQVHTDSAISSLNTGGLHSSHASGQPETNFAGNQRLK